MISEKLRKYPFSSKFLSFGLLLSFCFLAACSASPETKSKPTPTPTQTRLLPVPVKIDKPINVSFSTYSKDWPVDWEWIDPEDKYSPTPHNVKTGVLSITIPTKKTFNKDSLNAPRYLKPITGDFQIVTHIKFLPTQNYQGAGLLIYKDDNNYMRFERAYGGVGGGAGGIRIDVQNGDDYHPLVTPNDIQTDAGEVELKIVRDGNTFKSYWRESENAEWRTAGEYESDYPSTILAGLVACNTAQEVTVEFAYIRLLPYIKE